MFAVNILEFCEHLMKNEIICSFLSKIAIIQSWLVSTNVHKVCMFLDIITYY